MKYTRKLSVVEQRGIPLTHENVTTGMWVRVKKDVESVKKMCRGEGDAQQPERILGAVNLHRLDTSQFPRIEYASRSAEEKAARSRARTKAFLPTCMDGSISDSCCGHCGVRLGCSDRASMTE